MIHIEKVNNGYVFKWDGYDATGEPAVHSRVMVMEYGSGWKEWAEELANLLWFFRNEVLEEPSSKHNNYDVKIAVVERDHKTGEETEHDC